VKKFAPGLEPEASDRELMMGMKMPPARAVVLGIAGAISASATLSLLGGQKINITVS